MDKFALAFGKVILWILAMTVMCVIINLMMHFLTYLFGSAVTLVCGAVFIVVIATIIMYNHDDK